MSYETWCKEFYPIPASKVKKADAVQHSLTKWQGLTPTQLKKHEVIFEDGYVRDSNGFCLGIDGESCAMCERFYRADWNNPCKSCPGFVANGVECAEAYYDAMDTGNVRPMLKWIRKAI